MTVHPGNEQEAIISYDKELNEWHLYSDVPTLNRKWQKFVNAERKEVEPNGIISVLEGTINGVVMIGKKRRMNLSDEQRAELAQRAKHMNAVQKDK